MIRLRGQEIIKGPREVPKWNPDMERPEILPSVTYKVKSGFCSNSIFITYSYIPHEGGYRPYEMFIHSKNLTQHETFVILSRFVSAIFRKQANVEFVLEELTGIMSANGGMYHKGNYYNSIFEEIADCTRQFFYDIDYLKKADDCKNENIEASPIPNFMPDDNLKICPECQQRSLKVENGCDSCINAKCGYSKCDK